MEAEVDRVAFSKKIDWIQKVSPNSSSFTIGTQEDYLVIQAGEDSEFLQTKILADVVEEGSINIDSKESKNISTLSGSDLSITTQGNQVSFETSEGSISLTCAESSILPEPPSIEELGKVSTKDFRSEMAALKGISARKSDHASEGLTEADAVISQTSFSIIATNRIASWTSVLSMEESKDFASIETLLPLARWHSVMVGIKGDSASVIKTPRCYGVRDEETIALIEVEAMGESHKLNKVFTRMREEFSSVTPLVIDKAKTNTALTPLKKAKTLAKINFKPNGKATIESWNYPDAETGYTASFSIDYEGSTQIESIIINPNHLMQLLKGVSGQKANLYLPNDIRRPVGIIDNDKENIGSDSMGLTMLVRK